ncbi:hypothetical protein [Saguinine gammaherpesvirus 1]|uniref:Uncharacterized protein n=1 Tax=Saguinine gammaherpesvirus 1 TaxID=2169901 RepID=A0A9Q8QY63_9GAMA|nr:hypothetical protein [Saguinine gammaherpesvirus 1]
MYPSLMACPSASENDFFTSIMKPRSLVSPSFTNIVSERMLEKFQVIKCFLSIYLWTVLEQDKQSKSIKSPFLCHFLFMYCEITKFLPFITIWAT